MTTYPQLALPFSVEGTVTVNFDFGSPEAVSITAATRYNDRTLATATDAWAYIWDAIDTQDAGGTWATSEPSSGLLGRCAATRTPSDGRSVTTVVFSAGLTGRMFGFDSNTATASSEAITGTWQRQYLWILRGSNAWYSGFWEDVFEVVAETMADDHSDSTRDVYERRVETPVEVFDVPGCLVRTSHSDAVAAVDGLLSTDPNVTWEAFLQQWATTTGRCRFWADRTDLATYSAFVTLIEGLGGPREHIQDWTKTPLRYDLTFTGTREA